MRESDPPDSRSGSIATADGGPRGTGPADSAPVDVERPGTEPAEARPADSEPAETGAAEPRAIGSAPLAIVSIDEVPLDDVLALLHLALGEGPLGRGAGAFRWKHHESPFGRSAGLAAVAADGTLAGVRLFQRWRLVSGGAAVAAARAVDTATHPAWRRRGVFRRLTLELARRLAADGTSLIFNTPNPRSRAGYLEMGWRALGRAPLLVKPLRPGRLAGALLRRRQRPQPPEPPRPPAGMQPVHELLAAPGASAFLESSEPPDDRLRTPRTIDYVRWRYAALPAPRSARGGGAAAAPGYGALWRFGADAGAAVIARTRRRRGAAEVLLCEVLIRGGERGERAAAELIGIITGSSGADYLAAVAARGTPERRALAAAGFLAAGPAGPHVTVRELSAPPAPAAPDGLGGWRLSAGDLELF